MRIWLLVALAACGGGPVRVDVDGEPPERLGQLRLFDWNDGELTYNDGVTPYELNTPLFSDFAVKERAIWLPEGEAATYTAAGVFDLPVGTVLIKSFLFPDDFRAPDRDLRMIETRLLMHGSDGWVAYPYLWDADQKDARLKLGGAVKDLSFVDANGDDVAFSYLVPQKNQCLDCHEHKSGFFGREVIPIGPTARNLNRGDQLTAWERDGLLAGLPALAEVGSAVDQDTWIDADLDAMSQDEIDRAARDYLDVNCAHCHSPSGSEGIASQLFLNWDNEDPFHFGVCKEPGSAGNGTGGYSYDVVPGNPERSILHFRMRTDELGSMMPDIGRSLVDEKAVDLIGRWILGLDGLGVQCEGEPPTP